MPLRRFFLRRIEAVNLGWSVFHSSMSVDACISMCANVLGGRVGMPIVREVSVRSRNKGAEGVDEGGGGGMAIILNGGG